LYSKTRGKNSVQRRRRAATLQMAKNAAARFFSTALRNFICHDVADTTEAKFATFYLAFNLFAMFWSRAFRDHHNGSQITSSLPCSDHARDFVVIERNFGNQNDIGAAGDAAM